MIDKIYIIIPIHNRKDFTRACLCSLRRQSCHGFNIVIIDDGSSDGSSQMIEEDFPEVKLLRGNGNLWWTGATNVGVKYALQHGAKYIMTLNDDTIASEDFMEKMLFWAGIRPDALLGALMLSAETKEPVNGGSIVNWMTAGSTHLLDILKPHERHGLHEVSHLPGRGMLVPAKVFSKIGLFDGEHFPHYAADDDFSHRASRAGFRVFCNYDAKLFVYLDASGDAELRKHKSLKNYYHHLFGTKGGGNLKRFTIFAFRNCPKQYLVLFLPIGLIRRVFGYLRDWLSESVLHLFQTGRFLIFRSHCETKQMEHVAKYRPGAIETGRSAPIRVAFLEGVVPNYRVRFLRGLAHVPNVDITCFHGADDKKRSIPPSVGNALPVRSVWMKNYFWPLVDGRLFWQSKVRRIIQGRYDVIVCSDIVQNLAIWAIHASKIIHKKRIVLYGFGYLPSRLARNVGGKLRDIVKKFLLRSADAVLVYTEQGRENCIRAGIEEEKIFVSGNTLDTEYLMSLKSQIQPEELHAIKQRFDIRGRSAILYVGRLHHAKRADVLVDAFRKLRQTALDPVLLVIGAGQELKPLSEAAGLSTTSVNLPSSSLFQTCS
jgi:GT2 family glycosyltransferase